MPWRRPTDHRRDQTGMLLRVSHTRQSPARAVDPCAVERRVAGDAGLHVRSSSVPDWCRTCHARSDRTCSSVGLVFAGDLARRFRAFDAETGDVLWQTILNGPVGGRPMTYSVRGRQYLAIAAGGLAPSAPCSSTSRPS